MWNFAGQQNDIQGNGEPEHGNWITGFSFIDDALYWRQSKMPDDLKANKGTQRVLLHAADSRSHRSLLAGLAVHPQRKVIRTAWRQEVLPVGIQQFWVVRPSCSS